jgi:hypothetical protein
MNQLKVGKQKRWEFLVLRSDKRLGSIGPHVGYRLFMFGWLGWIPDLYRDFAEVGRG